MKIEVVKLELLASTVAVISFRIRIWTMLAGVGMESRNGLVEKDKWRVGN